MKRFSIRALTIAAVLGVPFVAPPHAVADNDRVDVEWEELTSEYEDDAWYDVTEWFDGNDYNPVGENVFDDGDNDLGPTNIVGFDEDQYGFDSRSDNDDWFYDYYDDNYLSTYDYDGNDTYEYAESYYDSDSDGVYDAGYGIYDFDDDGFYDYAAYTAYNDSTDEQTRDRARGDSQSMKQNKPISASGRISSVKRVSTPNGQNLVVHLSAADGQKRIIDLGPASNLDRLDPDAGDQLQVEGMLTHVGDKALLLATSATIGEETESIERNRRSFTGTIQNLKTADINGTTRQLAIVETAGKNRLVDMGAKSQLKASVAEGNEVTVHGPLVKVKDRVVVMCQKCKVDGETFQIDRRSPDAQKKAARNESQTQQASSNGRSQR